MSTAAPEVYDTEIIAIEKILNTLRDRAAVGTRDLSLFDKEIKERFAEIGFVVDVKWWHTNVEGVKRPDVEIVGRTESHAMDHDRLRHEIVNDVLGTGDGGVIKMTSADTAMIKATEAAHKKAHGHGH